MQSQKLNLKLDVSHNKIEVVNVDKVNRNFSSSITVTWHGNPIECDCRNLNFIKYLKDSKHSAAKFNVRSSICNSDDYNYIIENGKYIQIETKVTDVDPLSITCDYLTNCPEKCSCTESPESESLNIDCSFVGLTDLSNFNATQFKHVTLNLRHNKLKKLSFESFSGLEKINEIFASHNQIESLEFHNLKNLSLIELHNNSSINVNDLKMLNESKTLISLSGNPWACNCSTVDLWTFVIKYPSQIQDYAPMENSLHN